MSQRRHGREARGEAPIRTLVDLPADDRPVIYFATCRAQALMKVGTSTAVANRIRTLNQRLRWPLQLEALLPGGHATEKRIQHLLWDHWRGSEWYRMSFDIEIILLEIRSTGAWSKAPWAGDEFRSVA